MQRQRTNCRRLVLILIATRLLSASINAHPGAGIAVDRLGQVYFLDTGSGLWKIDTRGGLTHLSGTLFHWLAIDENNRFANTRLFSGALGEILKIGGKPNGAYFERLSYRDRSGRRSLLPVWSGG